ncbi:MAG TPA: hypothetical protein VGD84_16455 [Pseudonocardiaceae bacterium]
MTSLLNDILTEPDADEVGVRILESPGVRSDVNAEEVAEILVRLFVSLVLTPEGCLTVRTDEEARATARRYLVPLVTG